MEQESEYEKSRIERRKRELYSPDGGREAPRPAELSPSGIDVAHDWGDTKIIPAVKKKGEGRILKALVVFAVLTAFASGGYLLYQLFNPFAKPSDRNIIITFDVPVAASPGTPVDILVRVNNQNRVALEYATLSLLYPAGTRMGANPDKDLHDEKRPLGSIAAGQTIEYKTKVIFLGEEDTDQDIRTLLEYRFENINSVFTKEEVRPVHLLAAPVNLTVDTLREINAGQVVELGVNAVSNTVMPLRDILVKIEYPQGFTYTDATPKPTFGNNIWRVGVMNPGEKFAVKVYGVLSGEDTQEKVFHTTVGVGSDRTERDISTLYSKVLSAVTLKRPFIGIVLLLGNRPAQEAIAHFGERINGTVNWRNNLPTKIVNAQIEVRLRGVALDRPSISAGSGGFYRSSDDTIFWDERGDQRLAVLEAGEDGSVRFSFSPLPPVSSNQLLTNPTIIAEVTVRGKRISEAGVPEEVKTVMTQNVKITSRAQFAARAVYFVGPFINIGPIPPKVENETTYTIIWSLVNTSNTISSTQVRGVLPPYVKWAGSVSPGKENITYNRNTNEVIWSPGDIVAGTGIGQPPREVAFQVVFTPSLSQVKTTPPLVTRVNFSGTDVFTGEALSEEKSDILTVLSTDPKAPEGSDVVVP